MPDDPFGDAFGPLGPLVGRILGDLGSMDLGSLGDLRPPPGTRGTRGLDRFGRDLTADARAGLLDPDCALVDPALLAWGLAAACRRLGVRLHERTRVQGLGGAVVRWGVRRPSGR